MEEGSQGWKMIPRTLGVNRKKAELADILHPAEITGQMVGVGAGQFETSCFQGLECRCCAGMVSPLTVVGHLSHSL